MTNPSRTENFPNATRMMINTSDKGLLVASCQDTLFSTDPKAVADFLRRNCSTGGFTVQFAINTTTGRILEVFKKGKLVQRDIKPLIEAGFDQWTFSWAWAPKTFQTPAGELVTLDKKKDLLDLVSIKDVLPWARAFGF